MNCLSGQIETLRQQLLETVDHYSGDFLNPDVLRISQELDLLIVEVQRGQRRIAIGDDACHSEA
ncbi:MAG: aspartyl-phosphate phosphatase Spo0E family protein [Tumebacillaceae bacterium]